MRLLIITCAIVLSSTWAIAGPIHQKTCQAGQCVWAQNLNTYYLGNSLHEVTQRIGISDHFDLTSYPLEVTHIRWDSGTVRIRVQCLPARVLWRDIRNNWQAVTITPNPGKFNQAFVADYHRICH